MSNSSARISALIALSSAARNRIPVKSPASSGAGGGALSGGASSSTRSSSSTRKRVPWSTWLRTSMVPPISSTMLLVIVMPRPVPCTLLVVLFSARVKASKIVSKYSGVMP